MQLKKTTCIPNSVSERIYVCVQLHLAVVNTFRMQFFNYWYAANAININHPIFYDIAQEKIIKMCSVQKFFFLFF